MFFSFAPGFGSRTSYEVTVEGHKASGILHVEAATRHGRVEIRSMILTTPTGGRYDLLHNVVLTEPSGSTSI